MLPPQEKDDSSVDEKKEKKSKKDKKEKKEKKEKKSKKDKDGKKESKKKKKSDWSSKCCTLSRPTCLLPMGVRSYLINCIGFSIFTAATAPNGKAYYYNKKTGVTSWTKPDDL